MNSYLNTLLYTEREITYDGSQLSPHWIYRELGILGDCLVAFIGPASVALDKMVDVEDVKRKSPIYSPRMLHLLGEWFHDSLEVGVLTQHLLVAMVNEILWQKSVPALSRRGNDIYVHGRKLNVSIATRSSVSVLIHVGINIETEGTPVPTAGLSELGIDPQGLAAELLEAFQKESTGWHRARCKVTAR